MPRRHGMQLEILLSLLVVVMTATGILGGLLFKTVESRSLQIRSLMASALREDAASPLARVSIPGQRWWTLAPDGLARAQGGHPAILDDESRELGREARARNAALLREGMPWEPIRFAAPLARIGYVAVMYVPPAASSVVLIAFLVGDVAVFTVFGGYLLRRRVVVPMQRLAVAARGVADGALDSRLPIEVIHESAEVAIAFNEMAAALENRTRDLEKAVSELRESNRHLRDAREGLDRAERLAAVGRLAAGVAHEVGNPMGAMLAFLDLVRRDDGVSEASQEYLQKAAREGERVRVILRQVLEFSSPPRGESVRVEIASLCEETASLLRAQRRYDGITIEITSEGDPPDALAVPNGVSQILLNLLLNAADALRRDGATASPGDPETRGVVESKIANGPRIQVTVRPAILSVRADDRGGRGAVARRGPDAVECVVQDNGPGVSIEDRERIFDPFFTTNPPGEGTGLGLSNAARLAEELGGSVTLDPVEEGVGARFVLRLPAASAERSSEFAVRANV